MKPGIHPDYVECSVRCSCGNTFTTRSTKSVLKIDICNKCHPFFTGQQKFVDTGGRVQRFADKFGSANEKIAKREAEKKAERAAAAAAAEEKRKTEREAKAAAKAERAAEYAKKAADKAAKEAAKEREEASNADAATDAQAAADLDSELLAQTPEADTDEPSAAESE